MFEDFTIIPEEEQELVKMYTPCSNIVTELVKTIDHDWELNWYADYPLQRIAQIMMLLSTLSKDTNEVVEYTYYDANQYNIKLRFKTPENKRGIVMNKEAGTHFDFNDFPGAEYLTKAEEYLKQTPQHFLKIFTHNQDNRLYVWTNKSLTPMTFMKILQLQAAVFPRENPIADAAINAYLDKDVVAFKKVIIDYLTSDAVTEAEFNKFKSCLSSSTNRQISKFERAINDERGNINYWEEEITKSTAKIREWNEQIDFLKTQHEDDADARILYRFLRKNPYIKSFEPKEMKILLQYEAPIIYFSDYPAEKYLNKDYVSSICKKIVKIILGRKYQLMTTCAIKFRTTDFGVEFENRSLNIQTSALPHPHIMRFHCFGNHGSALRQAAETGNFLGAIEQISQAVMNINFYDSCVINEMLRDISNNTHAKFWRNKDTGEWYSTAEIIERNDYYEEA